jgi:hypothetical protein
MENTLVDAQGKEPKKPEPRDLKTYSPGNPIRVELDLHDDSGVARVVALFLNTAHNYARIVLEGDGGGQKTRSWCLSRKSPKTVPGEYYCNWIDVYDIHGNHDLKSNPQNLRFRIENTPGDYEAPELKGWRTL